jgi:hypothetical protein
MKLTIIALLAFVTSAAAQTAGQQQREMEFMFNADLPYNAVEVVERPEDGCVWYIKPETRPEHIPATCVLVEVYWRETWVQVLPTPVRKSQLLSIGWIYMESERVNWLHSAAKERTTNL